MSRFICSKLLVLHYLLRLTQPTMELFLPLPGGVCSGNAVYYVFKSKVIREVYWLQKEHRRDAQSREKVFVLGVLLSQKLERGSQSGGCYVLWGLALSSGGARPFLPPARFAEEACALLTSSKFEACHHAVSPLPYLQNCHYDVCSCSDGRDCLCSAVASYAAACAWRGVHIAWREPSFCVLSCPQGQVYLQCGTPCNMTCRSLSYPDEECNEVCLEGCFCPPGLYLDERGDCVPKAQCPCYYDGEIFQPEDIFSDHHTMW